ncbi:MAG: hypothetical protein IJD28_05215, partial [Deferribacterales bacterium]|nr:hypothetical protein [Deferribacterales bacterium]
CTDEDRLPDASILEKAVRPAMLQTFPAALLGRLSIIPYYPLGKKALNRIIDLKLNKIVKRVKENYGAEIIFDQLVREEIISRCDNVASGARLVDAIINNDLLPDISSQFLVNVMDGKTMKKVSVSASDGKFTYSFEYVEI